MCCPGVSPFVAAAVTFQSEINERGVTVAWGVYVGIAFAATMLHISLVRSATWFWNRVLSSVNYFTILFVSISWILLRVINLEVHMVSIFPIIALYKPVS